jgi:hypothetical protein
VQSSTPSGSGPTPTYEDNNSGKDSGFQPREDENAPLPPAEDEYNNNRDTFKVDPEAGESTIRQKAPAPMSPAEGTGDAAGGGNEAGGGTPPVEADKEAEAPNLLQFNFDDKVTWRSDTDRARLKVRANFTNPVVARAKVDPNSKWVPVPASNVRLVSR